MRGPARLVARVQEEYFAERVLDPRSWVITADDLWSASELLLPALQQRWAKTRADPDWRFLGGDPPLGLNSIRLMLCAYALENLFKAILVERLSGADKVTVQASGKLPKGFASHNLVVLATRAGIKLTVDESAVLGRLADAAVVFGRYPVPRNATALFAEEPAAMQSKDANALIDADLDVPGDLFRRVRGRFS